MTNKKDYLEDNMNFNINKCCEEPEIKQLLAGLDYFDSNGECVNKSKCWLVWGNQKCEENKSEREEKKL